MATYVLVAQKPRGFPENQLMGPRPGDVGAPSAAAKAKKAAAAAAANDENKPLTPYQREAMRKLRRHFQTVQHSPLRYQSIEVSRHRERVRRRFPSSEGKIVKYPSYVTQLGVPEYVPKRGRFTWFTGDWYEGSWLGDVMCGHGRKVWPSGDAYEGQWMDGRRHGRGTYTFKSTGDVYEGEYFNNSKNGRGVLTFANGDRFEGVYKNDMKDGEGRLYRKQDGRVFTELWRENELVEQIREQ